MSETETETETDVYETYDVVLLYSKQFVSNTPVLSERSHLVLALD
jgi:hypothetical protein